MDASDEKLSIPKFNDDAGDSFHLWQMRMRAVFEHKGVLALVTGQLVAPSDSAAADEKAAFAKLKAKATALLILALGNRPLKAVQKHEGDPATMWTKLTSRYASKTTSTKLMLLNEVFNQKYLGGTSLADHIADLELGFTKLAAAGQDLDELLQVSALLSSLSGLSDYESTIAAIRTMDESKATWELVTSRLIDEFNERSQTTEAEARLALTSAASPTPRTQRGRRVNFEPHPRVINNNAGRGNRGRNRRRNNQRGNNGGNNGGNNNANHGGGNAPNNRGQGQPGTNGQPRLTVLHCEDSNSVASSSSAACTLSTASPDTVDFLVDSGASHHMSFDIDLFSSLNDCDEKKIRLGDRREVNCNKTGTVDILLKVTAQSSPFWLRLTNVLFVPSLRMNIMSVSAMDTSRLRVAFVRGSVDLSDAVTRQHIASGTRQSDGLYWIHAYVKKDGDGSTAVAQVVTSANPEQLWHARLGPVNQQALSTILSNEDYKASPRATPDTINCEDCTTAKGTRGPHNQPLVRASDEPGTCIFADLVGPMQCTSWGGGRYLLVIVDGSSRFIWHEALASKSDASDALDRFIAKFEATFTYRVRRLHTDNGGEFVNGRLKTLLADAGINHTLSVAYNLQSNGLVERTNRSLIERIRTLLVSSRLDLRFWAEAAIHAVRTLNVVPKRVLKNRSPYEVLHNSAPDLSTFRIFGCRAFMPIANANRRKMMPKMRRCILLASGSGNIYRVFEPHSQLLQIVRHVRCDETEIPGYGNPLTEDEARIAAARQHGRELLVKPEDENSETSNGPNTTSGEQNGATNNAGPNCGTRDDGASSSDTAGGQQLTEAEAQELVTYTPAPQRRSARVAGMPPEKQPNYDETSDDAEFLDADGDDQVVSANVVTLRRNGKTRHIALGKPDEKRPADEGTNEAPWSGNIRDAFIYGPSDENVDATINISNAADPDMPTLAEALNSPQRNEWLAAIYEELRALVDRRTWRRVRRTRGMRVMKTKFVLKVKRHPDNSIDRYKARLVVLGFMQRPGDYDKTFSPVADFTTVILFLTEAARRGQDVHHLDVANAFLYAFLVEELYISLPAIIASLGFNLDLELDSTEAVYQLLRSIYGLRQAPRVWYDHLSTKLRSLGLEPLKHAESGFAGYIHGAPVSVVVYVDDLIVTTPCPRALATFKRGLQSHFDMRDFREVKAFLNIAIERRLNTYTLSQRGYVEKVLHTFNMRACNPAPTPMEPAKYAALTERRARSDEEATAMAAVPYRRLVGMLLYLSTHTRPDIAFATGILARHMSLPRPIHWAAGKRVLRYLRGTTDFALHLGATDSRLTAYADADWAGGADRVSVTGNVVYLGGSPVLWRSGKQPCTALSSTEAEYVSLSTVARDVSWLRSLCAELGIKQEGATPIYEDNTGAVAWANDISNFQRNKHIDVRTHYVRELVDCGKVEIVHVPSNAQSADTLTKPHHGPAFIRGRDALNVRMRRDSTCEGAQKTTSEHA